MTMLKAILARLGLSCAAIALALVVGAVILGLSGYDAGNAFAKLFQGGLGLNTDWRWGEPLIDRPVRLGNMLNESALLILVAIAVSIPLWCGMINLGAEGQLMMGGLGSVLVALYVTALPPLLVIPLSLAAGSILGAAWASLAGVFKVYRGLNEIITTIMLNFVAFWFISLLTHGPLKDQESTVGYPWTPEVARELRIPFVWADGRILLTIIFALVVAALAFVLLRYTTLGFKMRAAGLEPGTADFVGFPVGRLQVLSMALSGAISGFAGGCLLLGMQYRLSDAFASNYGFDALAVVLVGQGNPLGVTAAGFFFGILRTGAEAMEVSANVPKSLGVVLQALTLLFLMASQGKTLSARWRKWRMMKEAMHD